MWPWRLALGSYWNQGSLAGSLHSSITKVILSWLVYACSASCWHTLAYSFWNHFNQSFHLVMVDWKDASNCRFLRRFCFVSLVLILSERSPLCILQGRVKKKRHQTSLISGVSCTTESQSNFIFGSTQLLLSSHRWEGDPSQGPWLPSIPLCNCNDWVNSSHPQ